MILAVFTLVWLAVSQDCRGGAEAIPPVYEVLVFDARVTGTMLDGFGNVVPVYAKRDQHPVTAETFMSIEEPAAPQPGEVTYIGDPVAVDAAGNRSGEPCSAF